MLNVELFASLHAPVTPASDNYRRYVALWADAKYLTKHFVLIAPILPQLISSLDKYQSNIALIFRQIERSRD